MPRFYFDTWDNDRCTRDDVGVEVADLQKAKQLAAKSLANLANDILPDGSYRHMAVEVRDESGEIILTAELRFEARLLHSSK
jgi:hypothetical protein